MIFVIILIVIIILLLVKYNYLLREKFETEEKIIIDNQPIKQPSEILPDSSVFVPDNIMSFEKNDNSCQSEECERIDNYRNKFFAFQDRLNGNSHLNDSVDNINITNKAQNYNIGTSVADIFDDLVNSNQYKSETSELCNNITPDR